MKKNLLTLLLIALVWLQAMTAVADVHQFDGSFTRDGSALREHHQVHTDSVQIEITEPDHDAHACEHCCHCHGSPIAALAHHLLPLGRLATVYQPIFRASNPSQPSERFLRPPIV